MDSDNDKPHANRGAENFDPLLVQLENFDGPLDLLLYLVRKQEMDIHALRLSELTEPYLAYVERMQELNLDQAGEFLSIAATLVWLKSKSLLPLSKKDEEEPDPDTVEELLLLRLQEYQRIKDAALELEGRDRLGRDMFARQAPRDEWAEQGESVVEVEEISIFSLIEAFQNVLKKAERVRTLHVIPERVRIEEKLDAMLTLLTRRHSVFFEDFFEESVSRKDVILTFIALLELMRLKVVGITQADLGGSILCEATEAFAERSREVRNEVLALLQGSGGPISTGLEAESDLTPAPGLPN